MKELAKYQDASGNEVRLTDVDMKRVLSDNPNITDQEMKLFVELCKAQRLNPFIREAYIIKYGDKPASMVVGKDVYTKRAQANPKFKGMQAGVFVINKDGRGKEREGSMVLPGEQVVGGWCKVYVEDYDVPIYDSVGFDEYAVRKRDGSLSGTWAKMPGTMIRKVAMVHALREAFPDEFQGLYDESEMRIGDEEQAKPEPERPAEPEQHAQPIEVEAEVIEDGTPYEQLERAVRTYCDFAGREFKAEFDGLGVTEDTPTDWLIATAANYRNAIPTKAA